jgi:hypothetical protein
MTKHQVQWAAQFAVGAELVRRGYSAAFFLGNEPATPSVNRSSAQGRNVSCSIAASLAVIDKGDAVTLVFESKVLPAAVLAVSFVLRARRHEKLGA